MGLWRRLSAFCGALGVGEDLRVRSSVSVPKGRAIGSRGCASSGSREHSFNKSSGQFPLL